MRFPARLGLRTVVLGLASLLMLECAVRLGALYSVELARLAYLPGTAPDYGRINDVRSLIASTPLAPPPFANWAGSRLNAKGLRTHDYAYDKPPSTSRIVVLGDSFAFDSGFVPLDRMWHAVLRDLLQPGCRKDIEVVNLGVPAVGPGFALRMYELEGALLHPDLVIMSLFVGNDLTDECGPRGSVLRRYSATWRVLSHVPVLLRQRERERSSARRQPGSTAREYRYDPEVPLNDPATMRRLRVEVENIFSPANHAAMQRCVQNAVDRIAQLQSMTQTSAVDFVVLVIPDQTQVAWLRGEPGSTADFRPSSLHSDLIAALTAKGIATVDLLSVLRDASTERPRMYRNGDTHLSAEGNRVAAETLADALRSHGVLTRLCASPGRTS